MVSRPSHRIVAPRPLHLALNALQHRRKSWPNAKDTVGHDLEAAFPLLQRNVVMTCPVSSDHAQLETTNPVAVVACPLRGDEAMGRRAAAHGASAAATQPSSTAPPNWA